MAKRLPEGLARDLARDIAVEAVRLRSAPGSWRPAVRACVTLLVALVTLWSIGAVDDAAYASFAAFAVVYGGRAPVAGRWRTQAGAGALLVLAVVCGTATATSSHRAWLAIPVAALGAGLGAAVSDRWRWVPPGPMFLVFAVAACGAIPVTPAKIGTAALVASATAALGIALGAIEERLARGTVPAGDIARSPWHPPARRRVHAVRCAVAVALAGLVATAIGIQRPYWAMVAAVVPLAAATVREQLTRGVHRLAGTVLGLGVAGAALLLPLSSLATLILVAVLQAVAELLIARNYALALVFITPLALLITDVVVHHPIGELLLARLLETVIGVAVGVAIAVLTRARSQHALA